MRMRPVNWRVGDGQKALAIVGAPWIRSRSMSLGTVLSLLGAWLLLTVPVHAQDTDAAARAYRQAQAAELEQNFRGAAEFYELAHRLAPSPQALRAAMRTRLQAQEEAAAATHADELLRLYATDARSRQAADEVLAQVASHLARAVVHCSAACELVVDGRTSEAGSHTEHIFYLAPGAHELGAAFDTGRADPQQVDAAAGQNLGASFTRPDPPAVAEPVDSGGGPADGPPAPSGIDPLYFALGVGLTAVAGGLTIWSGIDTLDRRAAYDRDPSLVNYRDGHFRMDRTNALIGITAGLGVVTVLLMAFTNWGGAPAPARRADLHVAAGDGFVLGSVSGIFQ